MLISKEKQTNLGLKSIIDSLGGTYLVNPIDKADDKDEDENSYGAPSLPIRHRKMTTQWSPL